MKPRNTGNWLKTNLERVLETCDDNTIDDFIVRAERFVKARNKTDKKIGV